MRKNQRFAGVRCSVVAACLFLSLSDLTALTCFAQQAVPRGDAVPGAKAGPKSSTDSALAKPLALPEPIGARRLSPQHPIWIDLREKAVFVDGQISLREGMLEMFACTRNTKEHEAVVSADTKAYLVHAALLSLGAEAGHPVQFQPTYQPATGTEIEVLVRWRDAQGKEQTALAQDWVRDIRTKKTMTHPFVFGGSSFWTDPETGKKFYQAEGGDFVCVSNFGTAMLDIPVRSSQVNDELEFEAFTERIPPLATPVRLVFKPKLEERGAGSKEPGAGDKEPEGKSKSGTGTSSTGEVK